MVSSKFDSCERPLARHRLVNQCLAEELSDDGGAVHALSITAYTPGQWEEVKRKAGGTFAPEPSPKCQGGDGSLPRK